MVRMRPFQLGKETWDRSVVKKRFDERSYEIEANEHTYRRNRVNLKITAEGVSPHDYETVPTTPEKPPMKSSTANLPKEAIPLSAGTTASPPGTPQSGPVPGPAERSKRTLKEPTRFKDFINLVPRALVTLVQRNGKTNGSGIKRFLITGFLLFRSHCAGVSV